MTPCHLLILLSYSFVVIIFQAKQNASFQYLNMEIAQKESCVYRMTIISLLTKITIRVVLQEGRLDNLDICQGTKMGKQDLWVLYNYPRKVFLPT